MDEAHVEHAVGFVEHQMLYLREIGVTLLDEVEEPTRRRDQQVTAAAQAVDLRTLADAAEDDQRAQVLVATIGAGAVGDLGRELAGRAEHEHTRCAPCSLAELLQQRQHEACGLAGAGLGTRQYIAAREHGGDGLRLDRGRCVVAFVGDGTQQLGLEPEIGKIHGIPSGFTWGGSRSGTCSAAVRREPRSRGADRATLLAAHYTRHTPTAKTYLPASDSSSAQRA